MIADIVGVRRISGKGADGAYDYFKIAYTYSWPKGTQGVQGVLAGSCNVNSGFFDVRTPHVGDRLMLDFNLKGRVSDVAFID